MRKIAPTTPYKDYKVWQRSKDLVLSVYRATSVTRDYGYKDQLQRASLSIMNNIAEGAERGSEVDFVRFLYMAKGSCGEVRSMLEVGYELGYFDDETAIELHNLANQISKMLAGLIRKLAASSLSLETMK